MTCKQCYQLNIGIDWATSKHDVCIEFPDGKRSFDIIKASLEYIDEWITSLHQKYHGQIAVAVELCKGPIVYALQKYDFVTLFPINPSMLARYIEQHFHQAEQRMILPMLNLRWSLCCVIQKKLNPYTFKVSRSENSHF